MKRYIKPSIREEQVVAVNNILAGSPPAIINSSADDSEQYSKERLDEWEEF